MQAMDVLLAFPSLILGLILVAMLGPSMLNIIIAIALTSIPPFARIARAPTIAIKEREFVLAGRALGYSDIRLLAGHILPNILPEILVMGSLWLANAIRTEASLAFVGLGVKPPIATWGGMIREGFENILASRSPGAGRRGRHDGGARPRRSQPDDIVSGRWQLDDGRQGNFVRDRATGDGGDRR